MLTEFGADLSNIYFDVPRLRTATSDGYLQSGLAYAFKPHRDTWYSPPVCQLNWWLPIYPMEANNGMAFHPGYWNRPILNSSDEFNYQDWVQDSRKNAAQHVARDTRRQSEALEPVEMEPDLRLVVEPGGLIIFSAAHLHSTVNNTSGRTRLSIDFRTVSLDDLRPNRGAPNVDSACRGTTIRDYLRGSDFTNLPEDVCQMFEARDRTREVLLQEVASNCGSC
jgi:ectoine hydroxylase-related dioxygenase (phytanoyl-CoA dioxygenase family)